VGDWTDHEIARFNRRLAVFLGLDMATEPAESLAQSMLHRDRDTTLDDRRLCLECAYLKGSYCQNKHASVVKTFEPCKTVLWRCDYFWLKGTT